MSQPNLNEDLNIVANSSIEITLLDGDLNIIQALDDEPNDVGGLTSAELKAKFDEAGNTIKTYINGTLIPEILTEEATEAARAAAEAQRETNENQRIENENARIAAEQARVDETNGVVAQANQAAQSWAVGGTGTREGEDTNNAKYWSDKAREAAGGDFVPTSEKGAANGVATLGADALLAAAQRPKAGGLYRDDGTTTVESSLTEISTTLQKKADKDRVVNPNLLDNWYFGNPVDQRQGRIVKPNTTYYSDNQLTTAAGTTSAYVTAYRYATGTANGVNYASFKLEDSDTAPTYYAAPENVVRGYTGAGYGIDRWICIDGTLIVDTDGVTITEGDRDAYFFQRIDCAKLGGRTIALSILLQDGSLLSGNVVIPTQIGTASALISDVCDVYISVEENYPVVFVIKVFAGKSIKLKAAKLELGSQQTLAHQDADGNWVLNEIPSKAEQLAVCSNYDPETGVFKNTTFAPAYSYGTTDLTAGTSPLETGKLYFVYE